MCFANGTCDCITPCEHCKCLPRLVCEVCDLWIAPQDGEDFGVCPRKEWPYNKTLAHDSCDNGVWPSEGLK